LAITDTTLARGTYTTTIRFGIRDTGQNILALRDVQLSYTVTGVPIAANPNALSFSYVTGGAAPAAQTVTLSGDPVPWTASANQPWIGIAPSSGPGGGSASVSVDPTGLAPNTYNGTITFTAGGNTATVNVSLSVAAPGMQTSQSSLSYSGINGATLPSQSLNIAMNNGAALNWTVVSSPAGWLVLNRTNGTQADPLIVSVHPENGGVASGAYNSSIDLQGSSGGSFFSKTVNVTMALTKATLTASPASVTLGGSNGRDFSGVPVQLSLNTGANSFAWTSTASSFVQRSPSGGSVSATPQSVTLTPNATGLTGGTRSGSVGFSLQINGDAVSANVPVTFNLESHKLLVDGNGVAFTKTPTLSKLTQTLRVRDNLGLATNWSASSDQTWLLVTPSGTAGSDLVLSANPTGLAADSVNLATVTITSSDLSVENTEKVRVGLWVGSTDPDPTTTVTGLPFVQIVADPIRPYVYAAVGTDVQIVNVHNGSSLPPISNVAGEIGPMTVSHDGSTLYAVDTIFSKIVAVDLTATPPIKKNTFFSPSWLTSPVSIIDYTRTNGVGLIISGSGGHIFDAGTGFLFQPTFVGNVAVGASRGGSRFCTVDVGSGSVSISCPSLDFTSLNGGQLLLGSTGTASAQGVNAADIAVSADGTIAYVASGTSNGTIAVRKYATQDLSFLGGFATAGLVNNVEVAADGRIFGASENVFTFGDPDVWVFTAAGTLLTTRELAPGSSNDILARQMKVSGDGLRLIVLTLDFPSTAPSLIFNTVP
jgi:hypothetical protein